jgi:hypothetical protein
VKLTNKVEILRDRIPGAINRMWREKKRVQLFQYEGITFNVYVTDTPEEAMSRYWLAYFGVQK